LKLFNSLYYLIKPFFKGIVISLILTLGFWEVLDYKNDDMLLTKESEASVVRELMEDIINTKERDLYLLVGQSMENFLVSENAEKFPRIKSIIEKSADGIARDEWEASVNSLTRELLAHSLSTRRELVKLERQKSFIVMTKVLSLICTIVGVFYLMRSRREYGSLKKKDSEIKRLEEQVSEELIRNEAISIFGEMTGDAFAIIDDKGVFFWTNTGFEKIFTKASLEYNWAEVYKKFVIPTTKFTGVKNSVKVKSCDGRDFILKISPFNYNDIEYRAIKFIEAGAYYLEYSGSNLTTRNAKVSSFFTPMDVVDDVVEFLNPWGHIFNFKIAINKNNLPAYFTSRPNLVKTEFKRMATSLVYFAKYNNYEPEISFSSQSNTTGYSFKMTMSDMHFNTEEINKNILINGKRFEPLTEVLSSIESNMKSLFTSVVIKNNEGVDGVKSCDIVMVVKDYQHSYRSIKSKRNTNYGGRTLEV
jgi:hypothetical protein